MNKVPLIKSASWADVEDEFPPSPPRAPATVASNPPNLNLPGAKPVTRIESRPGADQRSNQSQQPRQNRPQQQQGANQNNKEQRGEGESRKLWEPARPVREPQGGSWRSGKEASGPAVGEGEKKKSSRGGKKTRNGGGGDRGKPKSAGQFEILLRFAPNSASEEDIRKAFGSSEAIRRVKLVGEERAYVEFADKAAMDRALATQLPKWGNKDVTMAPAPQQSKKSPGEKSSTPATVRQDSKAAGTTAAVEKKGEKLISKAASTSAAVVQKKKQVTLEPKRANAFAALDTDTEEEDDEEEDQEDQNSEEDEERVDE